MLTGNEYSPTRSSRRGFTLFEVVMCLMIIAVVFGGIITGYVNTTNYAEWTGYTLAAEAVSIQKIERAHAATYDLINNNNQILTMVQSMTGFVSDGNGGGSATCTDQLDLPQVGTNVVNATSTVTCAKMINVAGNANVQLQLVKVDTTFPFRREANVKNYTISVMTYLAPDNRAP